MHGDIFVPHPIGSRFERIIGISAQGLTKIEYARMAIDKEDRRNEEVGRSYARVGEVGFATVAMPLIPLRREVRGRGTRRNIGVMANLRRSWRFVKQNEPGGIRNPAFRVPENGSRICDES